MKKKAVVFLFLFLLTAFSAFSQEGDSKDGPNFFLIPVLETVFSGDVRWRPDWPEGIPFDGFYAGKKLPELIELSNDDDSFAVRRDREGRLLEFPFFSEDGYSKVKAAYAASGALREMKISSSKNDEEKEWNIIFPADFLPYSELSPGGSFPPLTVSSEDGDFYLFIFETPSFLTETWYDSEGNMAAFCKASVIYIEKKWRVRTLQIYNGEEVTFEDYFFDSFGNISEADISDKTFSALYRDNRPIFWQCPDFRYEMQWDTQGLLTIVKVFDETDELSVEYRYIYEMDGAGSWVKRQETALSGTSLLVPQPTLSRGVWNRRIAYGD